MTMDFSDEAIGDHVGLVDRLQFRLLVYGIGPIDVQSDGDPRGSTRRLHYGRLDALVEQFLDVADHVVPVVAERSALGVFTPDRVGREQPTESSMSRALNERGASPRA